MGVIFVILLCIGLSGLSVGNAISILRKNSGNTWDNLFAGLRTSVAVFYMAIAIMTWIYFGVPMILGE